MFNAGSATAYLKLNTTGWTTGVGRVNTSLASLNRTFVRFGAVALGSLTLIEREFGKFDKAIRHATSVSETTEAQFKQMSEMALDASVRWNKAATDTAQAFYYLGSAGLTATEQMQAFNDTIMLSRAMGSELDRTAQGLVDVVRAFGLEFADSGRIADQLTKTVISANLHFSDLDQSLAYVGSTAHFTNNTLAETAAMLGIMANAGIRGSMAGTILRRALANLMSPTREMKNLIYELGLSVYDETGKMRPYVDILGQLNDKLATATDEYKNLVFRILFGVRAIGGQIQLFKTGSEEVKRYADSIRDAGGATERVAGKQMRAFNEILGQMWQEIRRVAIDIGALLAPSLERVFNLVRERLDVFREYIKLNGDAITETMKWAALLGTAALIIPPFLLLVTSLSNQFLQLALAIGKAGIAMATNPIFLLVGALYTLRATLLQQDFWKKAWEDHISPFLKTMGTGFAQTVARIMWELSLIPRFIKETFTSETLLNTFRYFAKAISQILIMPFTPFSETFKAEYDKLDKEMRTLLLGGETIGEGIWNTLFGSEDERKASYQSYLDDLAVVGEEIVWQGKEGVKALGDALKEQAEKDFVTLTSTIGGLMELLPQGVQDTIQELIDKINLINTEIQNIIEVFKSGEGLPKPGETTPPQKPSGGAIEKATEEATNKFRQAWQGAIRDVFDNLGTLREGFVDVLQDIRSGWASTMENFINGGSKFKDFMENMFLSVLRAFNHMVAEMLARRLMWQIFGKGLGSVLETSYVPGVPTHAAPITETSADWMKGNLGQFSNSMQKAVPVAINIENNGVPVSARVAGQHWNGREYVVSVVMDEYNTNPNFRNALRQ